MPQNFQIIVIGSSIAGLTFAHCLDHAGIDYIILEKHEDPEANIGGIIVISPNGACILDQLGLHDEVKAVSEPIRAAHIAYPGGVSITKWWPSSISQRLGYPFSILTRAQFLRILYRNLKDKSKVHVNKRVVSICTTYSGVSVFTADGGAYHGNLVVGADGVHSITRSEMWRIAGMKQPGLVRKEMSRLFADYRCVFGISNQVPGILPGDQVMKSCYGSTIFVIGGKNGLVGWFVMQKLDRRYYYPNVPRYSQADTIALCGYLRGLKVWKEIDFGDVWDKRRSFMMTVLEEGILRTWHHGPIVCIGDSSNKMTPNLAQGANMAIESAAALSNKLHHLFQSKGQQNLSEAQIISMLEDFSHSHYMRARIINSLSQVMTRMLARDRVICTFLGRYIALRSDYFTSFWLSRMLGRGVKLDHVPVGRARQSLLQRANGRVVIGFILIGFISVLFLYIWPQHQMSERPTLNMSYQSRTPT